MYTLTTFPAAGADDVDVCDTVLVDTVAVTVVAGASRVPKRYAAPTAKIKMMMRITAITPLLTARLLELCIFWNIFKLNSFLRLFPDWVRYEQLSKCISVFRNL